MKMTCRIALMVVVVAMAVSACSRTNTSSATPPTTVPAPATATAKAAAKPHPAQLASTPVPAKDTRITGCLASKGGHGGIATVKVTNAGTEPSTYHLAISFALANGKRFGAGVGAFESVPAGASRTIPIISPAVKMPVSQVVCSIISAQRVNA